MVKGILTINYDPSYIGFEQFSDSGDSRVSPVTLWRYYSWSEITRFIEEIELIPAEQNWQPRECIVRMPVELSKEILVKHFYQEPRALKTPAQGSKGLHSVASPEVSGASRRYLKLLKTNPPEEKKYEHSHR